MILTIIICTQNMTVKTAIIFTVHLIVGVATFHPRLSYYSLSRQDIWRYLYPPYAQNIAVVTAILYSK